MNSNYYTIGNETVNWRPSEFTKEIIEDIYYGSFCGACVKYWDDCTCLCSTCFGDYNQCRGDEQKCAEFTAYLEQFCDCCGWKWTSCNCLCDCDKRYKDCKLGCRNPKYVYPDTIVSGIVCNLCHNTLPPHTVERHLDVDDPIHECPHE